MGELSATLQNDPDKLKDFVAQPETWRKPLAGLEAPPEDRPLKLYQPAQQRFYLAAGSLVCRRPGLPDHVVQTGKNQRAAFVMRRLVPTTSKGHINPADPTTYEELGWSVIGSKGGKWQKLLDKKQLVDNEELLPAFPMSFTDNGRVRRLHVGYISVASRDTYLNGTGDGTALKISTEGEPELDFRFGELEERILRPWHELLVQKDKKKLTHNEIKEISFIILVDLADFTRAYFPQLWEALEKNQKIIAPTPEQRNLFEFFSTNAPEGEALRKLLIDADVLWQQIERDDQVEGYPFNLALENFRTFFYGGEDPANDKFTLAKVPLAKAFNQVFKSPNNPYQIPVAAQQIALPRLDPKAGDQYAIRFVYKHPCLIAGRSIEKHLISPHSEVFRLAPYFDPDAPGRPITISLPADTSPTALRKYARNVTIVLSNKMRDQINRFQGKKVSEIEEGDVDPGGGIGIGMICSFSIIIVFIIALVLVFMFLFMLNIVFWWKAFFKICFPIPVKK